MVPAAILRAQQASLFGLGADRYTYAPASTYDRGFAIYSGPAAGLGADLGAYDLNTPGAVAEIKRALLALASAESDPFKKSAADVATETTWKLLQEDDTWDAPTAEEFLLAVSRYRGLSWQIGEPYVQVGLPGGGPQPAVNGLELLAGAVRQRLGGAPAMSLYEAWRAKGCLLQATCINPPSAVSKPPDDTPVTRTWNAGLRLVAPPDAAPDALAALAAHDAQETAMWQMALTATSEAARADIARNMRILRGTRDAAAQAAIDSVPGRQGTSVDTSAEVACVKAGGFWTEGSPVPCTMPGAAPGATAAAASIAGPLVVLGVAALAAWWALSPTKGARR